jgi:hypothetical protein
VGLLSSIFGGGSSSSSTTSNTDARSVTDQSTGGGIGGANNRVSVSITDGSRTVAPVAAEAIRGAADVNVAAFRAVAQGQAGQASAITALIDLARSQSANNTGAEASKAGMWAAAAIAAAVLLMRGR